MYLRPVHHSEHRLPVSYTGASRAGLVLYGATHWSGTVSPVVEAAACIVSSGGG